MASLDEDVEASDTTVLRGAPWLRLAHLPERLAAAKYAPDAFRAELKEAHAELVERFRADESVETLVHARAELIDAHPARGVAFATAGRLRRLVAGGGRRLRPRRAASALPTSTS